MPTGYEVEEYPALGAGATDGIFQAQFGRYWGGPWTNLETEFRVRGDGFADQLRGALGGGWTSFGRVSFRGEARGALSLGVLDSTETTTDFFNPEMQNPSRRSRAQPIIAALRHLLSLAAARRSHQRK